MTARLRAALFLALATAPAACGGGDGGPGLSFSDSVSTADAEFFAVGTANYAAYVARAMNYDEPSIATAGPAMAERVAATQTAVPDPFPGRGKRTPDLSLLDWRKARAQVHGIALAPGEGCTTEVHGSVDPWGDVPVDENENGIPDDLLVRYVCLSTDTVATDSIVVETYERQLAYQEIAGSLYGMTVRLAEHTEVRDNHGHYYRTRFDANGTLDIRAHGVVDQASLTDRIEVTVGDGVVFTEAGERWDNAFTPSGTITGAGVLPAGTLTIGGRRYRADSNGENLSFTVTTASPLKYYSPCAAADSTPPFTAGALRGSLNGRADLAHYEVGFIGCGQYVIATEGTYDAAAVAPR